METILINQQLDSFLFMGCWNKDGCAKSLGQQAVAIAIQKEPAEYPLFLGGDNIYPDKHEGTKQYPLDRVEAGVTCLIRDTPRVLYATVGNHNIARNEILAAELALRLWTIRKVGYCIRFRNRAVILFNSNPLDDETPPADLDFLTKALGELQRAGTSYIFIMHHPIVSHKKKGVYVLPQYAVLLDLLIQYPPTLLLVADTHNYQLGIVEWKGVKIVQIVVGTGGADLDPIASTDPIEIKGFGGSYRIEEAAVTHGYLRVNGNHTQFIPTYTPTTTHIPISTPISTNASTTKVSANK